MTAWYSFLHLVTTLKHHLHQLPVQKKYNLLQTRMIWIINVKMIKLPFIFSNHFSINMEGEKRLGLRGQWPTLSSGNSLKSPARSTFHCPTIFLAFPSSLLLMEVEGLTITCRLHSAHKFHNQEWNTPLQPVFSMNFIVRNFQPFLPTLSSLKREKLTACVHGQLGSFADKSAKHGGKP